MWLGIYGNSGVPYSGRDNATGIYGNCVKCPPWKDFNGDTYNYIQIIGQANNTSMSQYSAMNLKTFAHLTAYSSSETISQFNKYEYSTTSSCVVTTDISYHFSENVMQSLVALTLLNNNQDTYAVNDDPVWQPDHFYMLNGNNEYLIMHEVPSGVDFSEDYANYYKRVPAATETVSCIKFSRIIYQHLDSNVTNTGTPPARTAMCYAYYLDTPLSIAPGEIKTLTIAFSPTED